MILLGVRDSFDAANSYLMILILRARSELQLVDVFEMKEIFDQSVIDLHRFKARQAIDNAIGLVDWIYDKGYLTRSEAFNIMHWLYWFDDPNRLDPEYYFFEDFRYE